MGKKSKPLSPEQFQQLLIATTNLPFIRHQRQDVDYVHAVLETPINFQMRVEVVVKALDHFDHHVQAQHGIHTFQDLQNALARFPDTEQGNLEGARWLWNNNHWTRLELLRRFMVFLERHQLTDMPALTAWAQQADYERDFKKHTKGMGLAVFNWLLLRLGVQVIKPDVWVLNFGSRVLGKRIPEGKLLNALMDIAPLAGVTPIDLDRTLWHHERMNLATNDVPALRVVWWHVFQLALQQRLNDMPDSTDAIEAIPKEASYNNASHITDRAWQVMLDDQALLRYREAGVTLIPHVYWLACQSIQVTHIRVLQAAWYEGFGLWMEVRTDGVLSAECFAAVSRALNDQVEQDEYDKEDEPDEQSWELENQPQFVATLDLDFDVLMVPGMMVDDLKHCADELAKTVTDAVVHIQQVLHRHANGRCGDVALGPEV